MSNVYEVLVIILALLIIFGLEVTVLIFQGIAEIINSWQDAHRLWKRKQRMDKYRRRP
jgi:uncharacterized protein HemY